MNKEELEKEAGEWLKSNIKTEKREGIAFNIVPTPVQIYCAGAEPRENKIKSLGERCLQLQKDKGELTDKVKELEQKLVEADNATDCFNRQEEIIAKAKELLKAVVDFYPTTTATILCEAEQFLKE